MLRRLINNYCRIIIYYLLQRRQNETRFRAVRIASFPPHQRLASERVHSPAETPAIVSTLSPDYLDALVFPDANLDLILLSSRV